MALIKYMYNDSALHTLNRKTIAALAAATHYPLSW